MESPSVFNLEVGQLAEVRSFECGYRGAWFRCMIKDILLKKEMILLDYYDFESEEPSWVKIYQMPPFYGRKPEHIKRQLMVRPQYPNCVVVDDGWKVGDLVDWKNNDCFWSAKIVRVLSDNKFQVESCVISMAKIVTFRKEQKIELPLPPSGEGREGEEGKHEAFGKDLRPSLEWSETEGWSSLAVKVGKAELNSVRLGVRNLKIGN